MHEIDSELHLRNLMECTTTLCACVCAVVVGLDVTSSWLNIRSVTSLLVFCASNRFNCNGN